MKFIKKTDEIMLEQNLNMDQDEVKIYRELRAHLDELPIGFPETKSGSDIKLLRHFFTPEEAKLGLKLNYSFETLDQIHERVKDLSLTKEELEERLQVLAKKGSIRVKKEDGKKSYATDILVIGMYEGKVNQLTEEFLTDMSEYMNDGYNIEFISTGIPQTRTVPVEKSITPEIHIPTYDEVAKIINGLDGPIMLLNCICRQGKDLAGEPCKLTSLRENCMGFGSEMAGAIETGRGREISKVEALEVLRKNQEEGLILQAGNALKPHFICSCCGDCCGLMTSLGALPRPRDFFGTNYLAEVDLDLCVGCGTCAERCQLNAIRIKNDVAKVIKKRCLGCGNCSVACPEEAMHLIRVEENTHPETPEDLYQDILRKKQEIRSKQKS